MFVRRGCSHVLCCGQSEWQLGWTRFSELPLLSSLVLIKRCHCCMLLWAGCGCLLSIRPLCQRLSCSRCQAACRLRQLSTSLLNPRHDINSKPVIILYDWCQTNPSHSKQTQWDSILLWLWNQTFPPLKNISVITFRLCLLIITGWNNKGFVNCWGFNRRSYQEKTADKSQSTADWD